jgi:NitT/TauT family transport system ATP-binding protein
MPIHIEGVTKVYGGAGRQTEALRPTDLTIADGTFVSLIGPSGCGKSTLLSIVAGLEPATAGAVTGAGRPGVVFQEAALFPWRTIRDNVAFGLQMQGVPKAERRERAAEALRMVHLLRFADAFPHELSGGMRQRAAIARALVTDPPVLLMDEPFGALDAQTRALLQAELLSVWERTRKTVLFVTHGLDEALALSDRILLMSARPGRIIGDFAVDAPRHSEAAQPRDPRADPALAALRARLMEMLTAEVEAVARAERDEDWLEDLGGRRGHPTAKENIGADI